MATSFQPTSNFGTLATAVTQDDLLPLSQMYQEVGSRQKHSTLAMLKAFMVQDVNSALAAEIARATAAEATKLNLDGSNGPMTGPLVLSGPATDPNGAVTLTQLQNATPPVFAGTDGVTDGVQGVVPAPLVADVGQFLSADGTWGPLPIATKSSTGVVRVGQGLNVQPDGTVTTKDANPINVASLTNLECYGASDAPEPAGPQGARRYWNAGYVDSDGYTKFAPGTSEWQVYDWDGSTATNIIDLQVGDVIVDTTYGGGGYVLQVGEADTGFGFEKIIVTLKSPDVEPKKWNNIGVYAKGMQVVDPTNDVIYMATKIVGQAGLHNNPSQEPTNWLPLAYAGGMRPFGASTNSDPGYEGIVSAPPALGQYMALYGDNTFKYTVQSVPATDTPHNTGGGGTFTIRASADQSKFYIDYSNPYGGEITKEIASPVNDGAGITNLAYTASPTNGIVASDTGADATLPLATGVNAGLMSPAQFTAVGTVARPASQVVYGTGTGLSSSASLTYVGTTLIHSAVRGDKIRLYNGTAGGRYGIGIEASNFQCYANAGAVFTWNTGGDLQAPGVNERMRLSNATGNLSIGTSSDGRSRLDVRSPGASNGNSITLAQAQTAAATFESITSGQDARVAINGNNGVSGGNGAILEFWGHANGGTVSLYGAIHGTQTDGSTAGTNNGTISFSTANNSAALATGFQLLPTGHLLTGVSTGANTSGIRLANLTSAYSPPTSVGSFLTVDGAGNVILANVPTAASNYFRGTWTTAGTFPNFGGSGLLGAVQAGDQWYYTGVATTMGGKAVSPGDILMALVDGPGQTGSNWLVDASNSLGYVAVNKAGDTGVGPIALTTDAVNPLEVTTLQQVQAMVQPTNLGWTASPTDAQITSSTGSSATATLVDATNAGLMSPADKSKLDLYSDTPAVIYRERFVGPSAGFTLAHVPMSNESTMVFKNKLLQEFEESDYSQTGADITITLAAGETAVVVYRSIA